MAGVPYGQWFKFCLPLLVKLMIASAIVLIGATLFGYGLDVQPQITEAVSQSS
jgi:hypothetical protein